MTLTLRRANAILALILCACGGGSETPSANPKSALADTCRVQLGPRAAPLPASIPGPPASTPTRSSRLVAHVDLKLGSLAKELEGKVAPRLAEERNKGIGVGGHLNYTVDRGPFTVAIEGDSLVVRTDVRGRAEACRGRSCYASCEPQGRATATVPLRLTPDYRFAPSRVTFAFTRGCEVRALGGMLKIDVTPIIQGELAPALRKVEQEIDGKLPPMRPQAERLWTELGKSRTLPLGGCVVTNPRGIVEGPVSGTPDSLRVRFGLVAYPEIRSRCGDAAPEKRPLPPLVQDPKLPPEDDLVLALVAPIAAAASALEGTDPFDAGGARARIARVAAVPAGPRALLDLGLRGEACGDLGVVSGFAWAEDGRSLRLTAPAFANGERDRAAGVSLVPETLVSSLGQVRFPPPVAPDTLKELVPTIASSMSDPSVDVSAKVQNVRPLDVESRGDDLAALVLLRGSVELKQR
jgi:hypothetical protein